MKRAHLAGLVVSCAFACHWPAHALQSLSTVFDCIDGKPADIAAQQDAELDGFDKRAWIAQGRVRKAIRLSDRERMHDEDRTFGLTIQQYPYGTPGTGPQTAEQIVAVEVNEDRVDGKKYLYTLTEATLYREDISDPSNPTDLVWLPLVDVCPSGQQPCSDPAHFQSWESMQGIKVWNHPTIANRGKVVLLTSHRIVVIRDKDFGLSYKSSASELFDAQMALGNPDLNGIALFDFTDDSTFNDLKVLAFRSLRIAEDGGASGTKAFVTAEMGSRALPGGVRGAFLIMACDLDMANLSVDPTFHNGTGSPGDLFVTYWNPYVHAQPQPQPCSGQPSCPPDDVWNDLYTVNTLDATWDAVAQKSYVYAACGGGNQVQRIDATGWFETGMYSGGQPIAPPTYRLDIVPPPTPPLLPPPIVNVLADPDIPGRFLALRELGTSVLVEDLASPGTLTVNRKTVGEPNPRKADLTDLAIVKDLAPGIDSSVWTTGDGRVDHSQKVLDFSAVWDPLQSTVDLVDEYPGLSSSDGGIYVDFGTGGELYIPTFGGVIRYTYDPVGDRWHSVPASYQPAEDGVGSGIALNTEHIDYGFHELAHHLYTVPGNGGFMEFRINTSRNLEQNLYVEPNPAVMPPPVTSVVPGCNNGNPSTWFDSWGGFPQPNYYSNDLYYLDTGSEEYVLTIITDFHMHAPDPQNNCGASTSTRHTQHAVLAFKWNNLGFWEHVDSEVCAPIPYPPNQAARIARTIDVAPGLNSNNWFAFVGHRDGFFSVKLDAAAGTMSLATDFTFGKVCRAQANEDRLFVWVEGDTELRIFEWDRATGLVDPGDLGAGNEPLGENQYDMSAGGGVTTFGGGRCFHMNFYRDPNGSGGSGHLMVAREPSVMKLAWPGPGGGGELPEDTISLAGEWIPENYANEIQDCRVYDMSAVYGSSNPVKILAVKNSEAFSIVDFE